MIDYTQYPQLAVRGLLLFTTVVIVATVPVPSIASAGVGATLPDARVYEMVTPPSNYDADVYVPLGLPPDFVTEKSEFETRLPFEVSATGDEVAYVASPTVNGNGNGGLGRGDEYMSARSSSGGWESPVNLQPVGEKAGVVNSAFYQAFSPDLSIGILQSGSTEELNTPLLSSQAPGGGYSVLYSRMLQSATYKPFFTTAPLEPDADEFRTPRMPDIISAVPNRLAFAGASSDYTDLLFEANGAFEGTGAKYGGKPENNLYESVDGRLNLVNILPGGGTEPNATFGAEPLSRAGAPPADFDNVISADGSRVFWTDLNPGKEALYMSENIGEPSERTVEVDASTVVGGKGGQGRFWAASKDGSKVFFTDSEEVGLTADTQVGSGVNLYMFETPSEQTPAGHLVDLTSAQHAEVEGVLGEGEEASGKYTIYFVAKGVLAGNKNSNGAEAELGEDNLYMLREGAKPVFVAALSPFDGDEAIRPLERSIGEVGDWTPGLGNRTAEVTPDGRSLVFMSKNQKFEGHSEEVAGVSLEEVEVYDSAIGEYGSLFCASCGGLHGVAPVMTPESEERLGGFLPVSNALTFQPTWVSGDGSRVFFDSAEPLVVGDTNGEVDVYEWERDGSGGCGLSVGCVYLLSGGVGTTSSWLVGGDASGDNVFFVTRAQLVAEDENENYDLYDARVDGLQPVTVPACAESACQGVPAAEPVFATPPTVTFTGVGNLPAPAPTVTPAVKKVVVKKAKAKKKKKKKAKGKAKSKAKGKGKGRKAGVGAGKGSVRAGVEGGR